MKKLALFFSYLFLLSCLGQISSDLYLPTLPIIRTAFQTTVHATQLSVALFMLGFALSQLVYGPLSDHIGRKKPLLIGLMICITGALICRFTHHVNFFIMGRLLQGAGAGAGAALFSSILRDLYEGDRLAKISSFFAISRVVLLASAPLIGSYLLHFFDWRACFTFLLVFTGLCFLGSLFILKETNTYFLSRTLTFQNTLKNIRMLCTHRVFMSYSLCVLLTYAGILAWLTILPFLLEDIVGLTPIQFGWISALSAIFFIIGGLINALFVERLGLEKMLFIGLIIMLIAGVLMLYFGLIDEINTTVIITPIILYVVGASFIFSNAYAGALNPFPSIAGTAAALFGFLQISGGAISSYIASHMHSDTQTPLAVILLCCGLFALFIQRAMQKTKFQNSMDWDPDKINP